MIFSTHSFIFIFLPLVWSGYFLLHKIGFAKNGGRHKAAKLFLVIASFIFYAIGSGMFVFIFMASVSANYFIARLLSKPNGLRAGKWRSALFVFGIILNVALLGYYKYADFFIKNFNRLFGTDFALLHIALPIGISFFTFQLIAYLADAYRGLAASYNFLDYLLFISFFPQLIVGPIVHHGEMVPQFEDEKNWRVNWDNVAKGLFIFIIGVSKKILIADPLTVNAQSFFDADAQIVSALCAWWHSIEYTVSYYFDLSSYADMAIGIGCMFNITIPENFNSPYKARNFQDYWRRWHITLSRFLGAYIFKNVYKKGSKWRNYYVATMATFFVSGFWHGAGWTFILWGIVNGILVCAASWMKRKGYSFNALAARTLTLLGIVAARIMFVCGFKRMIIVFKSLFNFSSMSMDAGSGVTYILIVQMLAAIAIIFAMPTTHDIASKFRPQIKTLVPISAAAGLCAALMGRAQVFLYFQF